MNTKKITGTLFLIGTLCGNAHAAGFYASAQAASANITADTGPSIDSGYVLIVNGGMSLADQTGLKGLGVEAEIGKSISSPSQSATEQVTSTSTFTVKGEYSYLTLGAYGTYTLPIMDKFSIKGKLGLVHTSLDTKFSDSCTGMSQATCDAGFAALGETGTVSDSGSGLAFGASASYAFANNMSAIVEVTRINNSSSHFVHIGAGVSMLF